ncbi:MAG TPA: DUF4003 family protein [Clostridia bacterium]|nr:DUF4003 family protein [Clostridia bacterium]
MKRSAGSKFTLFTENTALLRGAYRWQNAMILRLCAFLYTAHGQAVDLDGFAESRALIKKDTGAFSMFRSSSVLSAAAFVALAPDREECFKKTLAYYNAFKENRFSASEFLALAACQCAQYAPEGNASAIAARARAFYVGLRQAHWFLTGHDDVIFAAMLALSPLDVEEGVMRIEENYRFFKPVFHAGAGVQALSQTLVISGAQYAARERVLVLYEAFREKKLRFNRQYCISALGVLALLPMGTDEIVEQVARIFERLRTAKGFGAWSVTKRELMLLSSGLAALDTLGQAKSDVLSTSLFSSVIGLVIAQQTALAAAAAASASSASS